MNTRQAIQPSDQARVLSLAFSLSRNRFIAGLSDGIRILRSDNCLTTHQLDLPRGGGVAIAEAVDDRYIAYVGGGKFPASSPNVVVFWDAVESKAINSFDFYEPVRGLRINSLWMVVLLHTRAIVFEHQLLKGSPATRSAKESSEALELAKAPNRVHALYPTAANPHAVVSLQNNYLVLPSSTIGQVQVIALDTGAKRVLRAHTSSLQIVALSPDAKLLATSSEKGTLIRVYDTATQSRLTEFRRGMDAAIIYGLAFSPRNRWLASTSDKGTLHLFDLRPPRSVDSNKRPSATPRPASYSANRLSSGALETNSNPSSLPGTGSPSYPASAQEYYGLRPPPISNIPGSPSLSSNVGAAATALAALKATPFAPRALHDIRSIASTPFYMGDDSPHWQDGDGPSHVWTVAPNGARKRVRRPILPLPSDTTGRPVKGVVTFIPPGKDAVQDGDSEDDGASLYVIGGGSDARWEHFELLPLQRDERGLETRWTIVNRGFRRFMTRQYP